MATHPKDRNATNPRVQCSVCGQWKRLNCKPEMSPGGYERRQRFFGGCAHSKGGDHLAGDHIDVCDDCCHEACKALAAKAA